MIVGSVCSGIGGPEVAWKPLGWKFAFASEIEKFPRAVFNHHHPDVPLHGDFTTIGADEYGQIDLLVGGTPCQSFSVAGLRGGMDDDRGNLALEFCRLAERKRPKWIVWENVPGVLSSNGGRDFSSIAGALAEIGYGLFWRILDAQYFGVPQRRRRVFLVGYLGDWRRAAAVLFERESMSGNPPPRRKKGEQVAGTLVSRASGGGGGPEQGDGAASGYLIPEPRVYGGGKCSGHRDVAATLAAHGVRMDFEVENFVCNVAPTATGGTPYSKTGNERVEADALVATCQHGSIAGTLTARYDSSPGGGNGFTMIAVHGSQDPITSTEHAHTLGLNNGLENVLLDRAMAVRRLTPIECERLMGFPDSYTAISWHGKPRGDCPNGPRYKALGNSMAVPVMRWVGERIKAVENISHAQA